MTTGDKHFSLLAEVTIENVACPLGCTGGDEFVLSGRDRLHNLPGLFNVVKCRSCGLIRTNPRPTSDTIDFYYPDDYGPYKDTLVSTEQRAANNLLKRVFSKFTHVIIQSRARALPKISVGRMLEVGCASGSFLHDMAKRGWQVEGIEFSEHAASAAIASGYSVHIGSLETAPDPDDLYDLIVGWMVLEHLHDPVLALKRLHRWSKPGGWLALSVPNAGSLEFSFFKDAWYGLHLPAHLFFFDPTTLKVMLERCGWNIDRLIHQRSLSNLIASFGNAIEDKFGRCSVSDFLRGYPRRTLMWHAALHPLSYVLSTFGQTGRMTIWARKQ